MKKLNMIAAAVMVGGVVVGGTTVAASAAENDVQPLNTCRLVAGLTSASGSTVGATVGRTGCTNTASWRGQVKKDLSFRPDPVIAQTSGTGNTTRRATGACDGRGNYYSFTTSSTGAELRGSNSTNC